MHLRQAGKEDINDSELKEVFEQWGEVRSIRRHKQTTQYVHGMDPDTSYLSDGGYMT